MGDEWLDFYLHERQAVIKRLQKQGQFCDCPEWDIDEYSYLGKLMCVGCGKPVKDSKTR